MTARATRDDVATASVRYSRADLLRRRADLSAAIAEVDRELAELELIAAPVDEYRTKGPLPSCVSRRTFNEACRSGRIVGARNEGREWICSTVAWRDGRVRASRPRSIMAGDENAGPDVEKLADLALESASLRSTRRPV